MKTILSTLLFLTFSQMSHAQIVYGNSLQLQGRTLSPNVPTDGQVVGWNSTFSAWLPVTISSGGGSSSGSAGAIQFSGGSGTFNSSTSFFWDNTQRFVGIGTTTPLDPIEVVTGTGTTSSRIRTTNYWQTNTAITAAPGFITRAARGTLAVPVTVQSGDQIGLVAGSGHDGTAFAVQGPNMTFLATETYNGGAHGSSIAFSTVPNGSTLTKQALQIDSDQGIELKNADTTFVKFRTQASSGNYTLLLPTATGTASQVIQTNGSGTLSFVDVNAKKLQGVSISTTSPTNGQVLAYNSTLTQWTPATSGGGSPGGGSGTVQFNNSGSFGGDNSLFWDNTNKFLGIGTATPFSPLSNTSSNIISSNGDGAANNQSITWAINTGGLAAAIWNGGGPALAVKVGSTTDVALDVSQGAQGSAGPLLFRVNGNGNVLMGQGGGFYLGGATSGYFIQQAAAVTTGYTITWPGAQASGTKVLQNDGAGNLSWAASGANTALSNLASTAVNAAVSPAVSASTDMGDATHYWNNVYANRVIFPDSTSTLSLQTGYNAGVASAPIELVTATPDAGQNSGGITLTPGPTSAGGVRGNINMGSHIITTDISPAVSSCGTSPSVVGTDTAGRITVGSGVSTTSCTLTFGKTFTHAALCTIGDESAGPTGLLLTGVGSTSTLVITAATSFSSHNIVYHCLGY